MAQTPTGKPSLRRSFSEHVKDSTNKAWDVFWKSVRERRLWGESGFHVYLEYSDGWQLGKTQFLQQNEFPQTDWDGRLKVKMSCLDIVGFVFKKFKWE